MVVLDIVDQVDMELAVQICRSMRRNEQDIKILLLVRPEQAIVRKVAVDTKNAGLADDFVFYGLKGSRIRKKPYFDMLVKDSIRQTAQKYIILKRL